MKRAAAAILLTVCVLASVTLAQAPQQPPKPGPEHKWMDYLVGRWTGEADVKASPFGPDGKFTFTEDVEWAPGGFFLVMHWGSKNPKEEAKGLTVMGYNAEEKVYFSRSIDSSGSAWGFKGPVEGDTWTGTSPEFKRDGKLMKNRYVSKRLSPTSFSFKMEYSTEGGPWSTYMEGKATKTPGGAGVASSQSPSGAPASAPRVYPDFALQAPPINTSPGPEYGSNTRVYQGVPGIERTAGGRLWAVWTGGGTSEGPLNYVMVVTSKDDGKSWSEPMLVIDPPGNVLAWDAFLWIDPLGRLWLFWTQAYGRWDGRGGVWTILSENADAEQPTWSAPRRLTDGMVQNKPTVLSTGEWLLPVWFWPFPCDLSTFNDKYQLGLSGDVIKHLCHDSGEQAGSKLYRSTDQGKTWMWLGEARVQDAGIDEQMIVERHDGSLWMLVRTFYGIGQAVSTDRGKTWGQAGPSGIRHPWTRFFIRRLKSGRLLMVRHNPPSVAVRSHLTAYLSDDDGRSWSGAFLLDERNGVSYPDGVEAANGKIYIIYDRGRATDREILMATFMETDVSQGACVSAACQLKVLINKATQ